MKAHIDQLEMYLLELEEKYINPHIDPLQTPKDYELDVRSFCVLTHAAFEEFVEYICIYLLNEIETNFINNQRISYSSLCLLHFKGTDKDVDDDTWNDGEKIFDRLKSQIKDIKSSFSNYIMENNHGKVTSLNNLAKYRGTYAHTSHRKPLTVSPEDAWHCVNDVYGMCMKLADKARRVSYYSIH